MAIYAGSRMYPAAAARDPAMLANARASVLVVHRDALQELPDGQWQLRTMPLHEALGLRIRDWARFDERDTPSAARAPCFSGVLLPNGRVLTALHGRRATPAPQLLRDLRFLLAAPGSTAASMAWPAGARFLPGRTLLQASAMRCGAAGSAGEDWAVFTLVAEHDQLPASVHPCTRDPAPGAPLYLAGFPFGMPLRISDGGHWIASDRRGEFRTRLNAFRCQSGAGIFDAASHRLAGWLLAGQRDLRLCAGSSEEFEWCEFDADQPDAAESGCSVLALPTDLG